MIGLLAAAFFAVMRFDLTFSRIALHGVTTPFFELAVLYCFDRFLERKRLADTAFLAVTLGIGLAFYTRSDSCHSRWAFLAQRCWQPHYGGTRVCQPGHYYLCLRRMGSCC